MNKRRHKRFTILGLGALAFVVLSAAAKSNDRIQLFPHLQNGENLHYETQARLNRYVKTKSNVATMFDPAPLNVDFSTNLQLAIEDFHAMDRRPMLAAATQILPDDLNSSAATPSKTLKVEFIIAENGDVAQADGLGDLEPQQRIAWQFWVSQFAFGWTLPAAGVKPGEKWKTVEQEKTPTPIANLVWERETTYVQDDQCPILANERCAVFLTTAILKQKSNPDDATPEDYKLHQLKTTGTANGKNQTVAYISRTTGLLVRATEDVQQSLDVTIAKADGSNRVQYAIDVTSHLETVLVPSGPSPKT
jgi:hypothetical protein